MRVLTLITAAFFATAGSCVADMVLIVGNPGLVTTMASNKLHVPVQLKNNNATSVDLSTYNIPFDISTPGVGLAPGVSLATPSIKSNAGDGDVFGSANAFMPAALNTDLGVQDNGASNVTISAGQTISLFEIILDVADTFVGTIAITPLQTSGGNPHPFLQVNVDLEQDGSFANIASALTVEPGTANVTAVPEPARFIHLALFTIGIVVGTRELICKK